MPLRIVKSIEPIEVKTITMCVYSPPGIGKTSLASSAEAPLLLDFDQGAYRSANRGDIVPVTSWADVAQIEDKDLAQYKTLICDTAGRALDALSAEIIRTDAKMGRGGALSLQGYGALKSRFITWLKWVRSFGIDVILVCHSDEQKNGDEMIERLDMQGGSKGEVYKSADVMGRLYLKNGKRVLNFSPTDTAFGKNPAQLAPIEVPDFNVEPRFLARVIGDIKAHLNKKTAEQAAASAALEEWQGLVGAATSAADFDGLVTSAAESPENIRTNIKRMIMAEAKKKGLVYDQAAKAFAQATPAPVPAQAAS
jgi:hypothetical protein